MPTHEKPYLAEPMERALALCRGTYQRDIVTGRQRWSGADLKGKARKYGGRYAESRLNLLRRMRAHGIPCSVVRKARGLLVLEIGGAS